MHSHRPINLLASLADEGYRIRDELAEQGGRSTCFAASRNGDEYVVKVTEKWQTQQEARAMLEHQHTSILKLEKVAYHGNLGALVTRRHECDLLTLANRRKDRGLQEGTIVEVLLQVGSALACMHAKGVAHCDVKPENIFLCHDGSFVLADLGSTQPKTCGSWACASDEFKPPCGGRAEQNDTFALGYTAFILAARKYTPNLRCPEWGRVSKHMPERFVQLVQWLMGSDAGKRPTMDEVLQRLHEMYPAIAQRTAPLCSTPPPGMVRGGDVTVTMDGDDGDEGMQEGIQEGSLEEEAEWADSDLYDEEGPSSQLLVDWSQDGIPASVAGVDWAAERSLQAAVALMISLLDPEPEPWRTLMIDTDDCEDDDLHSDKECLRRSETAHPRSWCIDSKGASRCASRCTSRSLCSSRRSSVDLRNVIATDRWQEDVMGPSQSWLQREPDSCRSQASSLDLALGVTRVPSRVPSHLRSQSDDLSDDAQSICSAMDLYGGLEHAIAMQAMLLEAPADRGWTKVGDRADPATNRKGQPKGKRNSPESR